MTPYVSKTIHWISKPKSCCTILPRNINSINTLFTQRTPSCVLQRQKLITPKSLDPASCRSTSQWDPHLMKSKEEKSTKLGDNPSWPWMAFIDCRLFGGPCLLRSFIDAHFRTMSQHQWYGSSWLSCCFGGKPLKNSWMESDVHHVEISSTWWGDLVNMEGL